MQRVFFCAVTLIFAFVFCPFYAEGQTNKNDSTSRSTTSPAPTTPKYNPKKASSLSAILPGLGQAYNKSYWKIPILYAGIGITVYYIDFNHQNFKEFKGLTEDLLTQQANGTAINENLLRIYRRRTDYWRKNRDLLYVTLAGIYVLNIVEAAIDAHLKGFNVDDNLALTLKPKVGTIDNGTPYIGVGFTLKIGK